MRRVPAVQCSTRRVAGLATGLALALASPALTPASAGASLAEVPVTYHPPACVQGLINDVVRLHATPFLRTVPVQTCATSSTPRRLTVTVVVTEPPPGGHVVGHAELATPTYSTVGGHHVVNSATSVDRATVSTSRGPGTYCLTWWVSLPSGTPHHPQWYSTNLACFGL